VTWPFAKPLAVIWFSTVAARPAWVVPFSAATLTSPRCTGAAFLAFGAAPLACWLGAIVLGALGLLLPPLVAATMTTTRMITSTAATAM